MSLELDEAGVCLLLPSAHCLAAKPVLKVGNSSALGEAYVALGG